MSLAAAMSIMLLGCSLAPVLGGGVHPKKLNDGSFEGQCRYGPNKAVVRVAIKDGRITDIELLRLIGSRKSERARLVVKRIIESPSAKVNAVTGATNSSNVIMNAVQKAVDKSYAKQ